MNQQGGGYLERPKPSGLADVIDIVLAKGLVLDAYVRVSLVGIELLTIDARVVISSVDTYLRFAEATNRLDLWESGGRSLPDVLSEEAGQVTKTVASSIAERKVDQGLERVGDTLGKPAEEVARTVGEKVLDAATGVAAKLSDVVEQSGQD
jgi:gas vesicle structural protein